MPLAQLTTIWQCIRAGAIAFPLLLSVAHGQDVPAESQDIEYVDTLEEIIVYGNKSLHTLREETIAAEEAVFARYNEINSNDDFDIHCYEEARTGTRIKTRICVPNYVKRITRDPRQSTFIKAAGVVGPYIPDWAGANKSFRELMAEMEALALENPELLDALVDYAIAKETLRKAKECNGGHEDCEQ